MKKLDIAKLFDISSPLFFSITTDIPNNMQNENIKYWLALTHVDGVGSAGTRLLLDACGSPRDVFAATAERLKSIPGIGRKTASRIKEFKDWKWVEQEIDKAEKSNVAIMTCHDPGYPQRLLNIYDYPPLLYVRGEFKPEDVHIAVVGSRAASTYGLYTTEKISRELALRGITVISGLARGIDSAAHRGALAGKGRTIAVLGCGADVVYPSENKRLYEEITDNGAIVTEFPFGTPPMAANFPARNRIISGISLGVVVVEATDKSGSLITARIALEQGREVFAVPGSIDARGSRGTNKLIKEGAKLVECVDDIIEEVLPQIDADALKSQCVKKKASGGSFHNDDAADATAPLKESELAVLKMLGDHPADVDALISTSGFKAGEIMSILMSLELGGYINQLPGKRIIRT